MNDPDLFITLSVIEITLEEPDRRAKGPWICLALDSQYVLTMTYYVQANKRIIDNVATRLQVTSERVISNLANYGNTSAASIPLALDEAVRSGKVKPGHMIAAAGFGAGLTWGSVILRWG